MTSCPVTEGHSCLDCAPPRRGRPFSSEGLSTGNPVVQLATAARDQATFASHWESVTVTRASLTFDDADPNHDGVVRIAQPSKAGKPSKKTSPSAARQALTAQIPVIISI